MDDLVEQLAMSQGFASRGLRLLRGVGAVQISHLPGDRKDYFEAEAELPALVRGFLRDQLSAKMDRADERFGRLRALVDDPSNSAPDGLSVRVERLQSWHNKARRLVPLVSTKYAGPGDSSTGVLNGIHASRPWMEYCGAPRMCPNPYRRAPGPSGTGCISKRAASV